MPSATATGRRAPGSPQAEAASTAAPARPAAGRRQPGPGVASLPSRYGGSAARRPAPQQVRRRSRSRTSRPAPAAAWRRRGGSQPASTRRCHSSVAADRALRPARSVRPHVGRRACRQQRRAAWRGRRTRASVRAPAGPTRRRASARARTVPATHAALTAPGPQHRPAHSATTRSTCSGVRASARWVVRAPPARPRRARSRSLVRVAADPGRASARSASRPGGRRPVGAGLFLGPPSALRGLPCAAPGAVGPPRCRRAWPGPGRAPRRPRPPGRRARRARGRPGCPARRKRWSRSRGRGIARSARRSGCGAGREQPLAGPDGLGSESREEGRADAGVLERAERATYVVSPRPRRVKTASHPMLVPRPSGRPAISPRASSHAVPAAVTEASLAADTSTLGRADSARQGRSTLPRGSQQGTRHRSSGPSTRVTGGSALPSRVRQRDREGARLEGLLPGATMDTDLRNPRPPYEEMVGFATRAPSVHNTSPGCGGRPRKVWSCSPTGRVSSAGPTPTGATSWSAAERRCTTSRSPPPHWGGPPMSSTHPTRATRGCASVRFTRRDASAEAGQGLSRLVRARRTGASSRRGPSPRNSSNRSRGPAASGASQ